MLQRGLETLLGRLGGGLARRAAGLEPRWMGRCLALRRGWPGRGESGREVHRGCIGGAHRSRSGPGPVVSGDAAKVLGGSQGCGRLGGVVLGYARVRDGSGQHRQADRQVAGVPAAAAAAVTVCWKLQRRPGRGQRRPGPQRPRCPRPPWLRRAASAAGRRGRASRQRWPVASRAAAGRVSVAAASG
jgi:hypothetical protein